MTADDTPPPPISSRTAGGVIRMIFIGREGLRAGWSIVLFLVFASLIAFAINRVHPSAKTPASISNSAHVIVAEGLAFLTMAVSALLVSLVERRPFSAYGLRGTRVASDLLVGAAWGLGLLSLLVAILAGTGALVFDRLALHGVDALLYGAKWLLAFFLVGLLEEFLFRGFLQFTLARGVAGIVDWINPGNPRARTIGFWFAAVILSVFLFALAHVGNGGETPLGLIMVALAGAVFVYALYRTGSLWWAIGFHAAWDWAQSFLYGVADSGQVSEGRLFVTHPAGDALLSGGTTGPEGSILVIPTLLLTALVIRKTLPKRAIAFDA